MRKILLTGANGRIGRVVVEGLRQTGDYEVVATDVQPDDERNIQALDVQDTAALNAIMQGVDTVIHLAWYMKSDAFYEQIVPVNVVGTYNVYEAARLNGVKRVIFGSSNHVTGYYRIGEPVMPDMPMRPDSLYGLSKCWGELVGRLYTDKYGLSSINIRIGNFSVENEPQSLRASHIWISHRDVVQLLTACIEARPEIDFLTLYGTSANSKNWYQIDYLSDVIGYQPMDDGGQYEDKLRAKNPDDRSDDHEFQGGGLSRREPRQ